MSTQDWDARLVAREDSVRRREDAVALREKQADERERLLDAREGLGETGSPPVGIPPLTSVTQNIRDQIEQIRESLSATAERLDRIEPAIDRAVGRPYVGPSDTGDA